MNTKNLLLAIISVTVIVFGNCTKSKDNDNSAAQAKFNRTAELVEVKKVIDGFTEFWETENMELLSKIMAHDDDMINLGSDSSEYFVGWEGLKTSIELMLPILENIKIRVQDQVIKINPSGNVVWFSQIWSWKFTMQGIPVNMERQRLSGVLEKRNGSWVIVQFHNSVPVVP